jgi:Tyosinase C-terminal domain
MSHSRGTPQKPEHGEEPQNVVREWAANIRFAKHELGRTFSVVIFLGDVPEDPWQWFNSPSFVGFAYAYAESLSNHNCKCMIHDVVYLESVIAKRSGLSSYDPSEVIPYLKDNLQWRIQTVRVFSLLCRARVLAIPDSDIFLVPI